jgi:hypothetical protein
VKIRNNPRFVQNSLLFDLATYWRELADTVNNHSDGIIAVSAPSSATDNGSPGQIAYDSTHFYVCIANNTWKRVAIATW